MRGELGPGCSGPRERSPHCPSASYTDVLRYHHGGPLRSTGAPALGQCVAGGSWERRQAREGRAEATRTPSGMGWPLPPGAGAQGSLYTHLGNGRLCPHSAHQFTFMAGDRSLCHFCTRACGTNVEVSYKAKVCDSMRPAAGLLLERTPLLLGSQFWPEGLRPQVGVGVQPGP